MNVIGDSADGQRFHFVFSRDTAEVRSESGANLRTQVWFAVFGAQDTMDKDASK